MLEHRPNTRTRRGDRWSLRPARAISLAVGVAVGSLVLGTVAPAAGSQPRYVTDAGTSSSQVAAPAAIPDSVSEPLQRARRALDRAVTQLRHRHRAKAIRALGQLKDNVTLAHGAGLDQIGAPPPDPESDDAPGPPSVLAVVKFEHQVTMNLSTRFEHRGKGKILDALRNALRRAHHCRDLMIDAVIALPPEGDGADYADGMADTLGLYTAEVKLLKGVLATHKLTSSGRVAVRNALKRVEETNAKMIRAFGGGE
jgi:hypothetical protein